MADSRHLRTQLSPRLTHLLVSKSGSKSKSKSKSATRCQAVRPESVEIVSADADERDKVISAQSSALVSTIEFNEHQSAKFLCRSSGSAPAARLSWLWKASDPDLVRHGNPIAKVLAETSDEAESGWLSSSLIEVRALDPRFHLAELSCVATNEALAGSASGELTAKVRLLVKCKYALVCSHDSETISL